MRFSVTSRCPGGVGQPPARLRGTMENASTGQMRSSNPPPACGAGCARVRGSRFGVWPHGKAHSARPAGFRMRLSVECAFPHLGKRRATSRKSALCSRRNRNSVHKCPRTAPRGRFRRSVYTLASPRLSTAAHLTEKRTLQPTQPQQCTQMPQNGAEGPFSSICVHSLSPRPLVRPGRARVPQRRRPHGSRDARVLGPEAHTAGAAAHLRCQALLSPLVALECHRHGIRRMPEQGQFGWASRLARFNAWGL